MKAICFRIGLGLTLLTQTGPVAARATADGTLLWQQTLNGGFAYSVGVDKHGDIVAAGYTQNPGTGQRGFTVAKFDRDGTPLWQQILNGGVAYSVAVDKHGDVVASGTIFQVGTVVKFDRDGTLLWQQTLNGGGANSVAVDNHGDVVAASFTVVAKFDGDGTLLWQQTLNGGGVRSVTVDNHGDVVAAGYVVAKFDRDGTVLWQRDFNGGTVNSVGVDDHGDVVAAGVSGHIIGPRYFDFTVAKFDGDGTLLWQQNLNGATAFSYDAAASVAVDNHGDVAAAGHTQNVQVGPMSRGYDFTAAKFDRDGTLLWQQTLKGGSATSVAVDKDGDVVAAGETQIHDVAAARDNPKSTDFTVAKFDRDGTLLWQQNLNGGYAYPFANSVAVDKHADVVTAGTAGTAFTVAKFAR